MGTIHRALAAHAKTNTRVFKRATSNSTPAWGIQKKANKCNTGSGATLAKPLKLRYTTHLAAWTNTSQRRPGAPRRLHSHQHTRILGTHSTSACTQTTDTAATDARSTRPRVPHSDTRDEPSPAPPGTRGLSLEGPRALTCGSLGLGRAELEGERQDQSLSPGHGWGAVAWVLETRSLGDNASGARAGAQGEPEP